MMNYKKYKPYPPLNLKDRKWPDNVIKKAPIWCSVDLRDGNQALPIPMSVNEKMEMFKLLLSIGFKEIEIGFPSASNTEYNLTRTLIENNLIPDGVKIQVLTQARAHLIEKTLESLKGAKSAIVHFYNSTSELQRRVVFNKNKNEIKQIAVDGAKLIKELAEKNNMVDNLIYEYSPESFTGTEIDYAIEVCEAVVDVLEPTKDKKVIINLPATVEMSTPNIYADQIEYFSKNFRKRDKIILSIHNHNDRGTAVAAAELAILAGADRVEGTLFGNGERTGNLDIMTVALNMFSQGIDPELDFSDINRIVEIYERNTRMTVHPRHPYAGKLVYTAFSGSHQDAISKGLAAYHKNKPQYWEVPYLPIDPSDLGREYEPIIRINSQSGKGGVAYIMETEFGYHLPKEMHIEFGSIIKDESDRLGIELTPDQIYDIFKKEYFEIESPLKLKKYEIEDVEYIDEEKNNKVKIAIDIVIENQDKRLSGEGNGPIDAFFNTIKKEYKKIDSFKFISYSEHALTEGSDSKAVSYIEIENGDGYKFFGVGVASSITTASIKAVISAINRALKYSK